MQAEVSIMRTNQANIPATPRETERTFARLVALVASGLFLLVFTLQAIALS